MSDLPLEEQIVVIGAGGTGLLVADSIRRSPGKRLMGFLDDDPGKSGLAVAGACVLGGLQSWEALPGGCLFISSLYSPKKNTEFFLKIQSLGIPESRWATVIDPTAIVLSSITLGRGSYIGPATLLEPNVCVGNWCALLGRVYVAHDTCLGAYAACANNASIAGGVKAGVAAFIGANATVREYLHIGDNSVVGMGAAVVRDVLAGSIVAGNPARMIGSIPDRAAQREGPRDSASGNP